jgi:hypothetical protein
MLDKSRIRVALAFIAVIFSLAAFAPAVPAQGQGCSVITHNKPFMYVISDGGDPDRKLAKLRIINNSNCTVTIETTSGGSPLTLAMPVEFAVSVHYLVQKDNGNSRQGFDWPDTMGTYDIPGGKSIVFMVPAKQLVPSQVIIIPFKYAWEDLSKKTVDFGPVHHYVSFRITEKH